LHVRRIGSTFLPAASCCTGETGVQHATTRSGPYFPGYWLRAASAWCSAGIERGSKRVVWLCRHPHQLRPRTGNPITRPTAPSSGPATPRRRLRARILYAGELHENRLQMIAPTFGIVADSHRRYDPVHWKRRLEMRITRWVVARHPKMNGHRRQWIRRLAGLDDRSGSLIKLRNHAPRNTGGLSFCQPPKVNGSRNHALSQNQWRMAPLNVSPDEVQERSVRGEIPFLSVLPGAPMLGGSALTPRAQQPAAAEPNLNRDRPRLVVHQDGRDAA
jgi:hypothetical protein